MDRLKSVLESCLTPPEVIKISEIVDALHSDGILDVTEWDLLFDSICEKCDQLDALTFYSNKMLGPD